MPNTVLDSGDTVVHEIDMIPICDANIQMRSHRKQSCKQDHYRLVSTVIETGAEIG